MPNDPKALRVVESASEGPSREEVDRYIDGFGVIWEDFGLSATTGRLFAYLLVTTGPVSLDDMVERLGAAKSSLSVSARLLVRNGMARRIKERGGRRVLYEAAESFESLIESEHIERARFVEKIRQGARVADTAEARSRIGAMAELFEFTLQGSRRLLADWHARQHG